MAKLGFDVDDVLADFSPAYMDLFIRLTGRNDFHAGDRRDPPDWDWPTTRGYSKAETDAVWDEIKQSSTFWLNLGEDRGCPTLRAMIQGLEHDHEVYFLTTRVGVRAKRQTEIWLWDHLGYYRIPNVYPTVGVAAYRQKGHLVRGLGLDCFIDDNLDNVADICSESPLTRVYLLNRAYNQIADVSASEILQSADASKTDVLDTWLPGPEKLGSYTRVDSLGEMFDAEIRAGHM